MIKTLKINGKHFKWVWYPQKNCGYRRMTLKRDDMLLQYCICVPIMATFKKFNLPFDANGMWSSQTLLCWDFRLYMIWDGEGYFIYTTVNSYFWWRMVRSMTFECRSRRWTSWKLTKPTYFLIMYILGDLGMIPLLIRINLAFE